MEKITVVNKEILKWAREQYNLDIDTVARRMGRDAQVIDAWENGEDFPTYSQLEEMAQMYKRPLAIFFFSNLPRIIEPQPQFRTIPGEVYRGLSYNVIKLINQALVMKINLEELNDNKNKAQVIMSNALNYEDKGLYHKIRDLLGVSLELQKQVKTDEDMFKVWRDAFYNVGITVFKDAFQSDETSGFCIHDKEFPIIYINNSMSFTRQIFTLFHELYHLLRKTSGIDALDDSFIENIDGDSLEIERTCNMFAGEFLVPTEDLISEIRGMRTFGDKNISDIASLYKVSREVILVKLYKNNFISEEDYNHKICELHSEYKRQKDGSKTGGNYYRNIIAYLGDNYLKLTFENYYSNKIDMYKLSEYTSTKIEHLSKLESTWGWRGAK